MKLLFLAVMLVNIVAVFVGYQPHSGMSLANMFWVGWMGCLLVTPDKS